MSIHKFITSTRQSSVLFALFWLLIVNWSAVQAEPITVEHVRGALEWAKTRGQLDQPLYLFLIGHASPDKIQLAKLSYLESTEFRSMLDDYQNATGNELIIVIDTAYAGSYVKSLAAPNRAIIGSTGENGLAFFFDKQGFSRFFAKGLFQGFNFYEAFEYARDKQERLLDTSYSQVPQLDDDGDGIFTDNDGQWLRQVFVNGNFVVASNNDTHTLWGIAKSISEHTFRVLSNFVLGAEAFALPIERSTRSGKRAAIIIAAGGNDTTNPLWDTTSSIANYIYKMFSGRGFDHEEIYYLSPASWADFNGDGLNDKIIDAPRTDISDYEDPEAGIIESVKGATIIIAGGPNTPRNELWDTTESISNYIYKVHHDRGFLNKQIYYLSPKSVADFNGDGLDDCIVDAPATNRCLANTVDNPLPERPLTVDDVRDAFAWAKNRGKLDQPLYLFLIGHLTSNKFHLADFTDLEAAEFKAILDDYQSVTGNEIVLVIDGCHSGSFLESLANPSRAIISASGATEKAFFVEKTGFSRFFAKGLYEGLSFYEAFGYARDKQNDMVSSLSGDFVQTPQLDDNSDGIFTDADGQWLRNVYINRVDIVAPKIEAVTISTNLQAGQALRLKSRTQGQIKRVWVEIELLDINFQNTQQLELSQANEENVWETTWNNAFYNGDYQITFYAENPQGKIVNSEEPVTISVIDGLNPPRQRLAIIVAGGGNHRTNSLWDDTESISNYIYYMLRDRKFTDDDIYYLTPETGADYDGNGTDDNIVDTPVRGQPLTDDDIRAAMDWAKERGTLGQPLYWFFTGHGSAAGPGRLQLAKLEYLKAPQLKELLDEYQNTTGNHTVLFIDACYSGVLVEQLKAPNRSIISSASANELAYFAEKQGFNRFIAKFLISGTNLFEAFNLARDEQHEMLGTQVQVADNGENITLYQNPQLDDNGDGIFNSHDGKWLENIHIGHKAESGSVIVEVEGITEPTTLQVGQSLTLKAMADTDTGPAAQVWALIRPPRMNLVLDTNGTPILGFQRLELSHTEDILWEGTWGDAVYNGDYEINFYAQDNEGNIASSDKSVIITVTGGVEPPQQANVQIVLEKDSYRAGEHFKAELIENLGWGYDLYVAVVLPDGNFIALKNTNEFAPLNQPQNWLKPRTQASPVTLLDLILPENLPRGEYCFYGILSPEKESVLETLPLWVWAQQCFEIF
ncbi:Peptidase C13, legumain [Candidatus Thiomargarita nelsonii]|uniref:Peptidase C13, legumain n=1 Tax=Candidatus Thiomargarita nelsonii TaxID=1003181 RepID=A0A0A6RKJ1_9GAMM|nr:Peptidase C13, legumain [Candidatus Thiomargarita nelsonii]